MIVIFHNVTVNRIYDQINASLDEHKILFLRHKRTSLAPNLWMLIYSMTSIKQFYEKHIADIQYVGEEMFWILQYLQKYRLFDFFIQTNVNLLQVSSWPL